MAIDVITEWNHFGFWRFLGNLKEFSGEIFCIVFRKFFRIKKVSTNHSPPFISGRKTQTRKTFRRTQTWKILYFE